MPKKSSRWAPPGLSALAGLALVAASMTPVSAQPTTPAGDEPAFAATSTEAPAVVAGSGTAWEGVDSDTGLWIVRFAEPSVAAFAASLSAEAGEGAIESYRSQLADDLDARATEIGRTLGRSVDVAHTYDNVLNGLAVEVSADEAAALRSMPGVLDVYPDTLRELDTDVSHEVILSDAVWSGETATDVGTKGEGIIVAMIDSGVNPDHPSFEVEDMDGYVHTNPHDDYLGVCAPGAPDFLDICNDKLIGAYNFHPSAPNPLDDDGHGSHVGSTIAGTKHEAQANIGGTVHERVVQGVAPRANVISYKVCHPGCPSSASVAAVNQAIDDDVSVLNYSISGSDFPWIDPVDLAFLDAYAAGISVVASAGNDGPGASTAAKSGPWNSAVAATTHHRAFGHEIAVTAPTPVPEPVTSMPGFPGDGPSITSDIEAPMVDAGTVSPGNERACSALPANSMSGAIGVVERGDCTFQVKVENAQAAGAVAVIIGNNVAGPPVAPGGLETTTIPAVQTDIESYQALVATIADNADTPTEGVIRAGTEMYLNDDWTDIVAGFSSRGPSQYDMLLPTFAAPGVNILAAGADGPGGPNEYLVIQGTSMSSPHGAGAAALLRALNPDWTPSEVRSALAGTGDTALVKEDGATPADPFDIGGGRINLASASTVGLVLDESHDNFVAANPGVGGDPATLNLPAVLDRDCAGLCSWERTVTSTVAGNATYTASAEAPAGTTVTVEPETFTLAEGESQTLTISVNTGTAELDTWLFGRIALSSNATHASGLAVADTDFPIAIQAADAMPEIDVDPSEVDSTQAPDEVTTHELSIGNTGGAPLTWEFSDEGTSGVIWHQGEGGTSGIVSDYGNVQEAGVYSADDFTVGDGSSIDSIYTPGFWNNGSVTSATDISWRIYADDGGVPASHPEDGDDAVWAHDSTPTGTGVTIADNNITLDVVGATGEAIDLAEGSYWLSVYPSINSNPATTDRWNWYQGAPSAGESAQLVDPQNLFGLGATDWSPLSELVGWDALAFTLDGEVACGADWVDVAPVSGTTAPGDATGVEVSLDSTGLEEGTYTTQLCLESNDPGEPLVTIPVTMTVEVPELAPAINVMPEALSSSQGADTETEHTVTIFNEGDAPLEWELAEAELAPPADSTPVTLPQGADRAAGSAQAQGQAPQQVLPSVNPMATGVLTEGFEDVEGLPAAGWAMVNNSEPVGSATWFQGNPVVFEAHEGAPEDYVGANFNSAGLTPGNINNWLLTPELELTNDSIFSFWTRTSDNPADWVDRLQVRLSTDGDSTDVGTGYAGVGDFTTHLLSVNEDLTATGYPAEWTNYEVTIEGLEESTTGRIGFRYWVPNGGPLGDNSNFIGIDTVSYEAADDVPNECEIGTDIPWMSAAPASGTTAAGESSEVTVTLDSAGLELDSTHEAQLCVFSNDPTNPLVRVPVTLEVAEAPVEPVEVERWSGSNRFGTAAAISQTYEAGAEVVFLATGLDFPDALTGSALAGSLDAPVLLTRYGALPAATKTELERLAPERVVVLGGTSVISDAVLVEASLLTGSPVERLSGSNRFGTAAAVAGQFDSVERVFVATGANYPDALSAAARAGALDSPVLLVRQHEIPAATAAALDALAPSQITVLGGEGAVDQSVVQELRDWAPTWRTGGLNRWITSAWLFAEVADAETVYVASGANWPDALAGGAKAGSDHEPLLLTRPDRVPPVIMSALERLDPDRVVVLGGTSAVQESVLDELRGLRDD